MGLIEYSILIILFLALLYKDKDNDDGCRKFVFVGMLIWFLMCALRAESVGGDTIRYVMKYEKLAKFNYDELIEFIFSDSEKDPIYHLSGWIFSRWFKHTQWWMAFMAAVFYYSVGKLIYNESKNVLMSMTAFIALGFFTFSLTGLRQTLATGFVIMSYPFLKNRKFIPFVITVCIGGLYHQTALIFLAIYPVARIKLGYFHIVAAILAIVVFVLFQGTLMRLMNNIAGDEVRFQAYLSGDASKYTMTGLAIQICIFVYCFYYYKHLCEIDKDAVILYNMSYIALIFQLYASMIAEFFRVSMYFSIFNIILLANASVLEKNEKTRVLVQTVIIAIFLLYFFKDGPREYSFFWQ